ncbi:site-specific integrase [Phreatobacter aquaticus]|uniref:Site-specific integrase n=1 Tax=Phreatobacter aquaticus TaxID=2570229 RepID=A0A4D7QJX6_9HYPH|nr:tyrosine-type recombinase/integrase [Phreatobacter aquaticus]QCK85606.1 site-specific integrase [Phreatobacter aquaticus]
MRKHHPKNERVKRDYFSFLEAARRKAQKSVDRVAADIAAFEASIGYRDFAAFRIEWAKAFKRKLEEQVNPVTGKPLAKATVHSRLMNVKAFLFWLAGQPRYRSRISYSDADYFNPSANDSRIATARRNRAAPTLEQIRHTIGLMPSGSDIEKRDRALMAFAILTGARDDAIASLSLGNVDIDKRFVLQDARTVRTKNRKTIDTWFFPVGDELEAIVTEWVQYLTSAKLFGPADPLFPATDVAPDIDGLFKRRGLSRRHWKNADVIRRIFREAFEAAGLPYFNPHSFRKTLALHGERTCRTPEEFKAWSQNLGHENVLTTFTSYGEVSHHRQAEILDGLRTQGATSADGKPDGKPDGKTIKLVLDHLRTVA